MPRVTDGQVRLFQVIMDENGDGEVTAQEFLSAAQSAIQLLQVCVRARICVCVCVFPCVSMELCYSCDPQTVKPTTTLPFT